MSTIDPIPDDGGPAREHLTVRDCFAAMALQGHVQHWREDPEKLHIARDAYQWADAMLAARKEAKRG